MKIRWSGIYIILIEAVAQGARKEVGGSADKKVCTEQWISTQSWDFQ